MTQRVRPTQRTRSSRNRRRHTRVRRGGNLHERVQTLLNRLDGVTDDMKAEYVRSNDSHLLGLIMGLEQAKLTYFQSLPEPERTIHPSLVAAQRESAAIRQRYIDTQALKHMKNVPLPFDAWTQMDQQHGIPSLRPPLDPAKKLSDKIFSTK